MPDQGYEYDSESDSMREALDRAREQSNGGVIDLDAMMADLGQTGGGDEPAAPPPASEEQPSKELGDAQPETDKPPEEEWARMKYEMRQNETRPPPTSPLVEKMNSVGWAPTEKASPWSPGWQELNEKLGSSAPAEAPKPEVQKSDPAALLKQVAELEAAQKAEAEKVAQQKANEPPPTPPPEQALLQQHSELEAAQKQAAEKKAADEAAAAAKKAAEVPKPPPGPDWEAMQRQVQEAERAAESKRSFQQSLHTVDPGFQMDPHAGEGPVDAAKMAMEFQQRKREDEARSQKESADLLEQSKKAAQNDPKSPESQRARDAFAAQFPDAAKIMRLDGLSANEIAGLSQREVQLEHYRAADAAEKAKLAEKEAEQKAKHAEKEAADRAKQAEKDKAAGELAKALEAERGAMGKDPRLPKIGLKPEDLAGMDRKALDDARSRLESYKEPKPKAAPAKPIHTLQDIADPADRAKVQAIGEGRASPQEIAGLKDRGRIMGLVTQVFPNFDATKYGAYKSVVQHQATDKDIVAARTAQEHIKTARSHIPENFDAQMLNRLRQTVLTGTGSAQMTPFEVDVKVAADEYAKALGNNAQSGREEVEHLLSAAQSPQQLAAALDEVDHLLATKQAQWGEQLKAVAPKGSHAAEGEKKPLETRPMKGGGTAFKGRKGGEWYDNEKEAEEN